VLSEHGVPIAPRTFHAWAVRAPSKRSLWDATITEVLAGYYEPDQHGRRKPESLYGSLKMWAHLRREGIPVANALAETTIGLYKNECIRADSPFRRGPLRTMSDVELTTADYVAWYNQSRLMHRLGRVPPTEAEAHYYSGHVTDQPAGSRNPEGA
jgi:transposase InsO family protein